jgi:hypothetical protein
MAGQIDTGDVIRLSCVFKNLSNAAVDPDEVKLIVKYPSTVEVEYIYPQNNEVLIKDSTGNYHCDIYLDQEGMWYYKWYGIGTVYAAEEKSFYVKISQI